MEFKTTRFIGSFNEFESLPDTRLPEVCFIGRSNVGKSSLINYLSQNSKLAKVSSTPGKTQSLNYFLINEHWYLVDLPGYGYAKRSKKQRIEWEKMMYHYFKNRESLDTIFLLIDSRIAPMKKDLEMIDWFGEHGIPFAIVFTKADQRESKKAKENIEQFLSELSKNWVELPQYFITSSTEKKGGEEILNYISSFI